MSVEFTVRGMSCQNCVRHAREAIEGVPGVTSAEVVLEPGSAKVMGEFDPNAVIAALAEEGYEAEVA